MPLTIKSAVINYKDPDTGDYVEVNAVGDTAHITDVQVNGTSVVADNVANIPYAGLTGYGVTRANVDYGTNVTSSGTMRLYPAILADIKGGTQSYRPIVSSTQHQSVFYGLAKLAGIDMANSENPVGEFTDEAKVAIQKMLGIYEAPWELIKEETFTNETEADYTITTDADGHPLELTDAVMWFETPQQSTYAKKGYYGQIHFFMNNNDSLGIFPEPGGWEQQANASPHGFVIIADQKDGMIRFGATAQTTYTNSGSMRYRYMTFESLNNERQTGIFMVSDFVSSGVAYFTKILIKSVTGTGHYKLYGKRKWE